VTIYITFVEALAIHTNQIDVYGGSNGVRDPGLLEAALFRPQTGYYNDIIEEAAALWESLAQNHPFIDGNKRTAFAVTYTFLEINGIHITATSTTSITFILNLYETKTFTFENLKAWLIANTKQKIV
jgi:death on curing protein